MELSGKITVSRAMGSDDWARGAAIPSRFLSAVRAAVGVAKPYAGIAASLALLIGTAPITSACMMTADDVNILGALACGAAWKAVETQWLAYAPLIPSVLYLALTLEARLRDGKALGVHERGRFLVLLRWVSAIVFAASLILHLYLTLLQRGSSTSPARPYDARNVATGCAFFLGPLVVWTLIMLFLNRKRTRKGRRPAFRALTESRPVLHWACLVALYGVSPALIALIVLALFLVAGLALAAATAVLTLIAFAVLLPLTMWMCLAALARS